MIGNVEHLYQNMEEDDGSSYGNARPHGLDVDDIVKISKEMGNPLYIVLQKNGRYAEVVSFYNKRNKKIVVSIDIGGNGKNYKYSQYMNGFGGGYYNVIVTQFEPDDLQSFLKNNTIIYDKTKMNGRYQVGSGRIVTITHDSPFIEDNYISDSTESQQAFPPDEFAKEKASLGLYQGVPSNGSLADTTNDTFKHSISNPAENVKERRTFLS